MQHIKTYEKLFESKSDSRILFLHGLGSKPYPDRVDIMEKFGTLFAPHVDYFTQDVTQMAEDIINDEQITHIIGHSMGGLLAYYLSNRYKLPALMFNPAFNSRNAQKSLGMTSYGTPYSKQFAVIGMLDDVVSPTNQENNMKHATIYKVKDLGHTIPPGYFEEYVTKFMNQTAG